MVITVQGYNGKKNKAMQTGAILAGMTAMNKQSSQKTLVIQLVDNDIDNAERMFVGLGQEEALAGGKSSMSEEGIDALMRAATGSKLMKSDFDTYCTPILNAENRLDVATITKNVAFTANIKLRIEEIKRVIFSATEVYEVIYVILPTGDTELTKTLNTLSIEHTRTIGDKTETIKTELIDKSIYCLHQGYYQTAPVHGKQIYYVVTDYENTSKYNATDAAKHFVKNKATEKLFKIEHSVSANDAALSGNLASFIRTNRDNGKSDANFIWSKDINAIVRALLGTKSGEQINPDFDERFSKLQTRGKKTLNPLLAITNPVVNMQEPEPAVSTTEPEVPRKKKRGFSLFGRRNMPISDETQEAVEKIIEDEMSGSLSEGIMGTDENRDQNDTAYAPRVMEEMDFEFEDDDEPLDDADIPEGAFDDEPTPVEEDTSFTVGGNTYTSFEDACEAYGLDPSRVQKRLDKGWDIEVAFEL